MVKEDKVKNTALSHTLLTYTHTPHILTWAWGWGKGHVDGDKARRQGG